MPWRTLAPLAVAIGATLLFTAVPGIFTIDEDNYLVTVHGLRHGSLHLPETAGLSASPELLYFDPGPRARVLQRTPVSSAAPPLYAFLALPFSALGVRGLITLNVISFLICCLLVFAVAMRCSEQPTTPWIAMLFFGIGSYTLEYAQGIWPHMLAVALSFGGVAAAIRAQANDRIGWAALAGLLAGLAVGVRYQNVVLAACTGLVIACFGSRSARGALEFGIGASLPLLACSWINKRRLGSWNPVSKNTRYLDFSAGRHMHPLYEAFASTWARVVDYSSWPPPLKSPHDLHRILVPDPRTGAQIFGGGLKKAWLQSSPWIVIALFELGRSWRRSASTPLRSLSLVVFGVLLLFAWVGFSRTDSVCFNQRYLLELLPALAVAVAVAMEHRELRRGPALVGLALGVVVATVSLLPPDDSEARQLALLKLPVLIAGALAVAWVLARPGRTAFFSLLLGAGLGWALAVHLGDDVATSRRFRQRNCDTAEEVARRLPDGRVALFAYWGRKDPFGVLHLARPLVVVDPWIDGGRDAPQLVGELLARGDRVVVLGQSFPQHIYDSMKVGRSARLVSRRPHQLIELTARR